MNREISSAPSFEQAADAIVSGEIATLQDLLSANPELIHARSAREHRATLLHYISANGVEESRQRTPENAVQIAEFLLQAGAEVDAEANCYGGSATTLDLVATSLHPEKAGVQQQLMQTLLDHDAQMSQDIVNSCLANGRGRAAEFLANHGAPLDLEAAAGVGWLDLVQSYFDEDGHLKTSASKKQMQRGFLWACQYGRDSVVDYLLLRGADLSEQAGTGETCLHWAVVGRNIVIIKMLLKHGASLETQNAYGGTSLGQAFWSLVHSDFPVSYLPVIETLLDSGARVENGTLAWLDNQRLSAAVKEHLSALLRHHGARS